LSIDHVTNAPTEEIGYTLTDSDGDTTSATLYLNNISNTLGGTVGGDTLTGTVHNDFIGGLAGNDTITGAAGFDIIKGGDGNDSIDGGADDDQLFGGAGGDTIIGGTGDDKLYGEAGNDSLQGGDGADLIKGGTGLDTLVGGAGADTIVGGAGNDTLTSGIGGADIISDTFRWELADKGTTAVPAADVITDFNTASAALGGDVLDVRDLLTGENHLIGVGNLASFLHFEKVVNVLSPGGFDTIVHISDNGSFAAGFNAAKDVQTITLTNVDLVTGFANDQAIIQNLLTQQKLITD
jgi:Ca2+-binding RTX toxin-like protein